MVAARRGMQGWRSVEEFSGADAYGDSKSSVRDGGGRAYIILLARTPKRARHHGGLRAGKKGVTQMMKPMTNSTLQADSIRCITFALNVAALLWLGGGNALRAQSVTATVVGTVS